MFEKRASRAGAIQMPSPSTWDSGGLRITASAEPRGLTRRLQLIVTMEIASVVAVFRGEELSSLVNRRVQQIESDSTPTAFLFFGGEQDTGAPIDAARQNVPGDAIALVITPNVEAVAHTLTAVEVERLHSWLRECAR
ncbi:MULTISPECIES: hypothetical protein [unclassified Curtobacterium]|uniref:hypothetical protein n=1 Tax=unclassified Curtobacterium TaxID=257496 RepID=UPI000F47BF72|nr:MULTISPECIES: hypothetical protein [unclassified Curtobacterium]ROS37616.1 hypothetical protein EDF53_1862 [Curtobacterium sp. PhB78]TCU87298.1 hypothetical protein EDF48_101139 [Curtobacterium sp. PhB191]TDW49266.1 hypothetical protein EDF52_10438 [Curtobacterium sp. PhB42]TDW56697.1 hypothetical protein EDF47_103285 [Curtobacterium sp. PhB190]